MSCRVLQQDALGVQLPSWLTRQPRPTPSAPVSSTEVDGLKRQLAEVTSALETEKTRAFEMGQRAAQEAAGRQQNIELSRMLQNLAEAITTVPLLREQALRRAERDTVRLAIEIARRVLHRELSIDPSALSALVSAALEKLSREEIHRVVVHPKLEGLLRDALESHGRGSAIEVTNDASLPPGSIVFDVSRGAVDASVESQLREIENGLADELRTRS
jgi:flagellar assembly protein FliH